MSAFTRRVEAAQQAIERLFSETSVEPQITLDAMEDLQGDIATKIDALRNDLRLRRRTGGRQDWC